MKTIRYDGILLFIFACVVFLLIVFLAEYLAAHIQ
jgi:hypothetical protein